MTLNLKKRMSAATIQELAVATWIESHSSNNKHHNIELHKQ